MQVLTFTLKFTPANYKFKLDYFQFMYRILELIYMRSVTTKVFDSWGLYYKNFTAVIYGFL